jgi:uncharacterized membrane protein YgdD (TMEM256/DUF423 family)
MNIFGLLGGLFGFLGVALGAFGAHTLKGRLSPEDLAIFETGVRYQMYHSLALLLIAVLVSKGTHGARALIGWGFSVGILVFSGSLYALVLTGERWLGAVTPIGGVAFLIGWGALVWTMFKNRGTGGGG